MWVSHQSSCDWTIVFIHRRINSIRDKGQHGINSPVQDFTQHAPFYGVYETNQRSVYLMQQRLKRHPFLSLFDGVDVNVSTARRKLTTVPTQSLYLMNSEFVHERAKRLSQQLLALSESPLDAIQQAFATILGRPTEPDELKQINAFIQRYSETLGQRERARSLAFSALIRTLLTRNEFLFVVHKEKLYFVTHGFFSFVL